jgi:polyvinyl alcohol dehydrogenase (cytochrome)
MNRLERQILNLPVIALTIISNLALLHAQSGERIFQQICSGCHREGANDAPSPATLRSLPASTILAALSTGKMAAIGRTLSDTSREAVAMYLGTAGTESIPKSAFCVGRPEAEPNAPSWNGWGLDLVNSRFQPAKGGRLARADVEKLKLKWAFGFPGVTTAFGTPAIYGGHVLVGSADGTTYSLNAKTGCIQWLYKATDGVRTGALISDDGQTAYISDLHAWVHAVNLESGAVLWKMHVDDHPQASITGTPKLYRGRLYVPVSGGEEEVAAGTANFVCCKFRGSLVALEAKDGTQVWKSYTIGEPAKMTGKTVDGFEIWGPSGASIWSSPTIDEHSKLIYVTTGVNYTQPHTGGSDAVFALDLDSGHIVWTKQLLTGDVYNFGCVTEKKANCPANPGKNIDIGVPPMLAQAGINKRMLVIAAKSGMAYGLNPDANGQIVWQTRISNGGPQGGVIWGASMDHEKSYFSISDWNPAEPQAGGGVVAVQIATGKMVWRTPAPKPSCLATPGCSAAQPGATTLVPGVVFAGSLDGNLRAYDAGTGKIIWEFNTLRDFATVNGIKAHGGSMNGTGPSIADGMVYANAGYSRFPVMAGNVFLAFSVDGK